jgi:hypothetical protein
MRVLITLSHLGLGGTETYSVTLAEQLEKLGHPTSLRAASADERGRELVASRGLSASIGDPTAFEGLGDVDCVVAQDAASAYAFAARRDDLPQVFVIHGLAGFEHPAQALHPAPPVITLNGRIEARAEALAGAPEVVRLRQPIDLLRHRPRRASRARARRVLVLGSQNLDGGHLGIIESACADLDLELVRIGIQGTPTIAPEDMITGADIVVGYGRSALEGLAMGRATYIWGHGGGDGWVTPENYSALEADGFSGAATGDVIDADRMRTDFTAYRPELGALGFDLVRAHHSATKHAEALLKVLERAEPPASEAGLETLALLVRSETRWMHRSGELELQYKRLAEELAGELAAIEAERGAEAERRAAAEDRLRVALGSTSWRLTAPLRRLGAVGRRGRRSF